MSTANANMTGGAWPASTGEMKRPRAEPQRTLVRGIVTAFVGVAVAAAVRWLLQPVVQEGIPYALFLAAVAVSTHRQGWRSGVLATALSVVVGSHLFVLPWSQ